MGPELIREYLPDGPTYTGAASTADDWRAARSGGDVEARCYTVAETAIKTA